MTKGINATGFSRAKPKPKLGDFTVRTCLRCNEEFKSYGLHNRICDICNDINSSSSRIVEKGGVHGSRATKKGDEIS